MLTSTDPRWSQLTHAYGAAGDIPALLERARSDLRPGHQRESAWFELWSALCHQGDAYTASYAALPHLVAIARTRRGSNSQFDPLHLVSCIELARLEERGPALSPMLEGAYRTGLDEARALVDEALARDWPAEYRDELRAGQAALAGRAKEARAIMDADLEATD
jgi:hypothetical protein